MISENVCINIDSTEYHINTNPSPRIVMMVITTQVEFGMNSTKYQINTNPSPKKLAVIFLYVFFFVIKIHVRVCTIKNKNNFSKSVWWK